MLQKRKPSRLRRALSVEALEDRVVLTGQVNVFAFPFPGLLGRSGGGGPDPLSSRQAHSGPAGGPGGTSPEVGPAATGGRRRSGRLGVGRIVSAALGGHRPGQVQQLARRRTARHLGRLARGPQPGVEGPDLWVPARGGETG